MAAEIHPSKELTLLVIKPDGIQRSLIGEVIGRIERIGFKLVATKFFVPSSELVRQHYTLDPEWIVKTGTRVVGRAKDAGAANVPTAQAAGEEILATLLRYLTAGPVLAMVWQGAHAAAIVKKIVGGTEPLTSDVGTIRGDLMTDSYAGSDQEHRAIRNIVHCSGNAAEAAQEVGLWFKREEIVEYHLVQDHILYDVNLDGILE